MVEKNMKMDIDTFWNIINEVNKVVPYDLKKYYGHIRDYYNMYVQCLKEKLKEFDFRDIVKFNNIYEDYKNRLYRYDVWYECAWVLQHASDDGFEYFLRWIVSRGKSFYFDVCYDVKNIEHLDWEIGKRDFEEFDYVWNKCIEEKWPDVYEVIENYLWNINCLEPSDKRIIHESVNWAFKNGKNEDESVADDRVGKMWDDVKMCDRWTNLMYYIENQKTKVVGEIK